MRGLSRSIGLQSQDADTRYKIWQIEFSLRSIHGSAGYTVTHLHLTPVHVAIELNYI